MSVLKTLHRLLWVILHPRYSWVGTGQRTSAHCPASLPVGCSSSVTHDDVYYAMLSILTMLITMATRHADEKVG